MRIIRRPLARSLARRRALRASALRHTRRAATTPPGAFAPAFNCEKPELFGRISPVTTMLGARTSRILSRGADDADVAHDGNRLLQIGRKLRHLRRLRQQVGRLCADLGNRQRLARSPRIFCLCSSVSASGTAMVGISSSLHCAPTPWTGRSGCRPARPAPQACRRRRPPCLSRERGCEPGSSLPPCCDLKARRRSDWSPAWPARLCCAAAMPRPASSTRPEMPIDLSMTRSL